MAEKKVALIAPNWLGDVIMMHSLVQTLKVLNAQVEISVFAAAAFAPLLARMPEITQIYPTHFKHGRLGLSARVALGKHLRGQNFDQGIVLPNSFKSALPLFWAKMPQRTGWIGELRHVLLNDIRRLQPEKVPTMVQRFVALAYPAQHALAFSDCPYPKLQTNPNAAFSLLEAHKNQVPSARVIGLCPGAAYGPSKRWPAAHFATLAKRCVEQGYQVWLLGGPQEQEIASAIQNQCEHQCVDWTGKTSLSQVIDLMSLCSGFVSNDSGLMHLAAAIGKPVLALYGPTAATFAPPLCAKGGILEQKDLSCRPCKKRVCPLQHHHCLEGLGPDSVFSALLSALA
jgi:heptosyltransferase II